VFSEVLEYLKQLEPTTLTIHKRIQHICTTYEVVGDDIHYFIHHQDELRAKLVDPQTRHIPKKEVRQEPGIQILISGLTARAEIFGDVVYMRHRDGKFESFSGMWEPLEHPHNFDWYGLPVEVVLAKQQQRYYFPRLWNPYGVWLTRVQLEQLWHQWQEQKKEFYT
jgi:hypothetical protein